MIAALDSVESQGLLSQAGQSSVDLHALSQNFDKLMAQTPDATAHNEPTHNDRSTAAVEFVKSGDAMMRQTYGDIQRFMVEAPQLSVQELTARQIEVCAEVTVTQFQFNSCAYLAQSSKSGLQTLMKNQ